ncbi:bifunctional DNA-formamidopyrimidine glycosylase/DNA-(apurinic or apyrimidinic site) lyase [Patescibacteria group bacterium]|nr:bifunctional DNA-formamidopyrimidine glycosylase/DNA-(apurinic or apyrimidinic site) lyase [Patescibacteria group bacterium]
MPELPEVELLKRGLTKYIVGLAIAGVDVRTPKIVSGDPLRVIGGRVVGIRRFGKMLSLDLSNGHSIAVHLKMTGRLIYRGKKQPKKIEVDPNLLELPSKHTHVIFSFRNGDKLYYNDLRKFGWIMVIPTSEVKTLPFVSKLGPEPLRDLDVRGFHEILMKYSRPVKTLLMDQERISGVGNIYANEALFCAGVAPHRKSNTLDKASIRKLYHCILKVLRNGMKYGGSSTDAFRDVLGQRGGYQEHHLVYDREGQSCARRGCAGIVQKVKMGGRGTYFCHNCQK